MKMFNYDTEQDLKSFLEWSRHNPRMLRYIGIGIVVLGAGINFAPITILGVVVLMVSLFVGRNAKDEAGNHIYEAEVVEVKK